MEGIRKLIGEIGAKSTLSFSRVLATNLNNQWKGTKNVEENTTLKAIGGNERRQAWGGGHGSRSLSNSRKLRE